MAFTTLVTTDIDAKSPLTDQLFTQIKSNEDHLKSAISDGASASQAITGSSASFLLASGTGLAVTANMTVGGTFSVAGVVTAGVFFSSEQLLELSSW